MPQANNQCLFSIISSSPKTNMNERRIKELH